MPWIAKSAGTLICLGADEILMPELSELGPLDSQITEEHEDDRSKTNSALNGFNALEQIQEHTIETDLPPLNQSSVNVPYLRQRCL